MFEIPHSLAKIIVNSLPEDSQRLIFDWISSSVLQRLCESTGALCWVSPRGEIDFNKWSGGSAFLVETSRRIFGVTAKHVVMAYKSTKKFDGKLQAQFGDLRFDLDKRKIEIGRYVDIATFEILPVELPITGRTPLKDAWPPEEPQHGGPIAVAGCPAKRRQASVDGMDWGIWTGWGDAGVSCDQITMIIDHGKGLVSPIPGVTPPPPKFNVGGISGGPLVLVRNSQSGNYIEWRLSGVISEGNSNLDYVVAARADIIQADGRIIG